MYSCRSTELKKKKKWKEDPLSTLALIKERKSNLLSGFPVVKLYILENNGVTFSGFSKKENLSHRFYIQPNLLWNMKATNMLSLGIANYDKLH